MEQQTLVRKQLKRRVDTPYISIWKEEGIINCVFTDNLIINIETAQHCVNERVLFSEGQAYPCLINLRGVKSMNRDAREYLATEGTHLIKAGAFLTSSALTKMLGNMFLAINKPNIPSRLFSNRATAIAWLKKHQ